MKTKLNGGFRSVGVAVLALSASLAGCASDGPGGSYAGDTGGPAGVWSPHSRVRLITLERSTTYTIVREEGRDLLLIEEGMNGGLSNSPDRFVWLVSIPTDAPIGTPVAVEPDGAGAWLLEYRSGLDTLAQPAWGTVTVFGRTEDSLDAHLEISAAGAPEAPGQLTTNDITLASRLALSRYQSVVPGTTSAVSRSGAEGAVNPDRTPRSVYGK